MEWNGILRSRFDSTQEYRSKTPNTTTCSIKAMEIVECSGLAKPLVLQLRNCFCNENKDKSPENCCQDSNKRVEVDPKGLLRHLLPVVVRQKDSDHDQNTES